MTGVTDLEKCRIRCTLNKYKASDLKLTEEQWSRIQMLMLSITPKVLVRVIRKHQVKEKHHKKPKRKCPPQANTPPPACGPPKTPPPACGPPKTPPPACGPPKTPSPACGPPKKSPCKRAAGVAARAKSKHGPPAMMGRC